MAKQPSPYTAEELVSLLKDRQGVMTQVQFAAELQISFQLLSQVYKGDRSVSNEKILAYLAPKGKKFVERKVWDLVSE